MYIRVRDDQIYLKNRLAQYSNRPPTKLANYAIANHIIVLYSFDYGGRNLHTIIKYKQPGSGVWQ